MYWEFQGSICFYIYIYIKFIYFYVNLCTMSLMCTLSASNRIRFKAQLYQRYFDFKFFKWKREGTLSLSLKVKITIGAIGPKKASKSVDREFPTGMKMREKAKKLHLFKIVIRNNKIRATCLLQRWARWWCMYFLDYSSASRVLSHIQACIDSRKNPIYLVALNQVIIRAALIYFELSYTQVQKSFAEIVYHSRSDNTVQHNSVSLKFFSK